MRSIHIGLLCSVDMWILIGFSGRKTVYSDFDHWQIGITAKAAGLNTAMRSERRLFAGMATLASGCPSDINGHRNRPNATRANVVAKGSNQAESAP
jgi:hypothetical protein